MKNNSILSSILSFIFPLCLGAQSDSTREYPKNVIKFKILNLAIDNLQFQYERVLNKHYSVALDIGYISDQIGIAQIFSKQNPSTGYDVRPEIRYYFSSKAPKGYYIGLYGLVLKYREELIGNNGRATNNILYLGGGIIAGKQWLINRMSIDADLGCGLYNSHFTQKADYYNRFTKIHSEYNENKLLVSPVLNLSLGYAF